jgi:dGTPase
VYAIAEALEMPKDDDGGFKRHPFVYLVEAADDICYRIVDMEDAHRLGILSHEVVKDAFVHIIDSINKEGDSVERVLKTYDKIGDLNEKISFLRAKAINILTLTAADVFWQNRTAILQGDFNDTLLDNIDTSYQAFKKVTEVSIEKIYNHDTVLEVEIAGYNVMSELLNLYVPALLKEKPDHKDEKVLKLFPLQFREFEDTTSPYEKVFNALDTISGMTDLFATELYRKLKGIDIPQHR